MAEAAEVAREEAAGFEFGVVGGRVIDSRFTLDRLGGVVIGHGLRPHLGLAAQVTWSPDFGERDLTGLTKTVVQITRGQRPDSTFVQPLDKQTLAASLALTETAYGRVGWFGGRALPFSIGGLVGGGVLVKRNYEACAPNGLEDVECPGDPATIVVATYVGDEIKPAFAVGGQFALHLNATWAVRLDVRDLLYVDRVPDYDPYDGVEVRGGKVVSDLVATVGLVWFTPRLRMAQWTLPIRPAPAPPPIDPEEVFEEEPPEPPAEITLPVKTPRDLDRGLFMRADLGAAAYLGRYGSSPNGAILRPGASVALGFGGDHRVGVSRYAVAWELQGSTSAHNGPHWRVNNTGSGLQGDTRTFSTIAVGTLSVAPVPRLDLGVRIGGGVMIAPMLFGRLGDGFDWNSYFAPTHGTPHPVLLVGPTFQFRTGAAGFVVGAHADFVYAAGFDYGVNAGGFARVTLR